jgi:hypothetical protein
VQVHRNQEEDLEGEDLEGEDLEEEVLLELLRKRCALQEALNSLVGPPRHWRIGRRRPC